MLSTSLPSYLWGDVALSVAHLINWMSSHILHLQTPLECHKEFYPSTCLISIVPLWMFGCTTYVYSHGPKQTKFIHQAQAWACMFVRYSLLQRGYKRFHQSSHKYFVSMDVTFLKNRPFFSVSLLQRESVGEESNYVVPLESTHPTLLTLPDPNSDTIVLSTDQVHPKNLL